MTFAAWVRDMLFGTAKSRAADKAHEAAVEKRLEQETQIVDTISRQNKHIQEKAERIEEFMVRVRDGNFGR